MTPPPPIDVEDTCEYLRPQLSVYLACSLTSDQNRPFKDEVLGEVAQIFAEAGFDVHNPALHTPPGSPHLPSEVYFEDLYRTIGADFIFFLRLGRSHGMGIEAQLAADVLLPWADARVTDDWYSLSPLLAGLANAPAQFRTTVTASSPTDFYAQLEHFLRDRERFARLATVRHMRDAAHGLIREIRFGYHVRVHRLIFGLSASDLGRFTDIDPTWIEAIESDPRFVSKLTLIQVARLCDTLQITFGIPSAPCTTAFPVPQTPTNVSSALLAAAATFATYSLGSGSPSTRRPMEDNTLFRQWKGYMQEKNLGTLQRPPQQLPRPGLPLRIFLCYPLSNVSPTEKHELDGLLSAVATALHNSGIDVTIETPSLQSSARQDHAPEIYLRRLAGLRRTDLAITFLDPASTGVGIMLQLIHDATVPCLCVTKHQAAVSRMVRGLAPVRLYFIEHSSTAALGPQLADWLSQHMDELRQSQVHRESAWSRLGGLNLRRAMTLARLASAPPIPMPLFREEFTERLESCDDLTGTVTLFQLAHIAIAQHWRLVPSSSGFLCFEPAFVLPEGIRNSEMAAVAARISLTTLWDTMQQIQVDESRARQVWSTYLRELSLNAARKEKKVKKVADLSRSVSDWLRVLSAENEF
jgi:hypothetical protein